MTVVATLMGSRCFGGGLAKLGREPMWVANPLSTLYILLLVSYKNTKHFKLIRATKT
jgi:hypothetical protein